MAENTLRQATNVVEITGVVSENNLEYRKTASGDVISGDIVIKTGEGEEHTVSFFANKLKKDGTANRIYESLETVKNDYKSIASYGEDEADKVSVTSGEFRGNDYVGQDGMLRSGVRINSNFINRLNPSEAYEPKSEFDVEVFIKAVKDEFDREGNETGRVIVDAFLPLFGGRIAPISFSVAAGNDADFVRDTYEKGNTVNVYGEIVNKVEVKTTEKESSFGKGKKTTIRNYVREFLIKGGSDPYDEDNKGAYSNEQIKKALTEREAFLEELKNKPRNGNSGNTNGGNVNKEKKSGFGSGTKEEGTKKTVIADDDLPF